MTAPNSSQGPGGMGMNMGQPGLPTLAPAQQGLPTLAPAPPPQHQQNIQTSQIQQMHPGKYKLNIIQEYLQYTYPTYFLQIILIVFDIPNLILIYVLISEIFKIEISLPNN